MAARGRVGNSSQGVLAASTPVEEDKSLKTQYQVSYVPVEAM